MFPRRLRSCGQLMDSGEGESAFVKGVAPGGSRGSSKYSHPPFLSIFKLGSMDY